MLSARIAIVATLVVACQAGSACAQDDTIVIESWRDHDRTIWQDILIPAFESKHPGIKVVFAPSSDDSYDAALLSRLEAGKAGDVIACRPFAASQKLYREGYLEPLDELPVMEHFSDFARSAWTTGDGKVTFCVPVTSVIHGFLYNADAFEKLGIAVPTTETEFFATLDRIKEDGTYVPLAMGTKDFWEAGVLGYQNIGPTYWKGEEGRIALLEGRQRLTDRQWTEPFVTLARWEDYLGEGFETRSYADSQKLFASGGAAIYPAGSWELSGFDAQVRFRMGAFPPPVRASGDTCYISDQPDMGLGLNAGAANREAARIFLEWAGSSDFAAFQSNAMPGFYSLRSMEGRVGNPLAREFVSWRSRCRSTMRFTDSFPARGKADLAHETWLRSANVINGSETPQEAAETLHGSLAGQQKPAE